MYDISEFLKCKSDPIYFIENYLKIFNQSTGLINFKLYEKQKEFIKLFFEKHKILVLKSRQTGMTTTIQQLALYLQLFYERYYIGVISIEQEKQNNFLREIVEMYETSELYKYKWIPKLKHQLQKRLVFENGSEIRQGNSNNPLRSYRMSLVIVDEQQFVENLESQLKSIAPTLQTISKSGLPWGIILNSTPNGVNNYYYQLYYNQINNENGYHVFTFHWKDVPFYDEEWYKEQCALLGHDYLQIQQELELKFISEQDTFLEPEIINILQNHTIEPLRILDIENIRVEIYEDAKENEVYYFGVDVQSGLSYDYSAGVIINDKGEVCQVFHDKHADDIQLQRVINTLGRMYHAKVGVEVTGGFGLQVLRRLKELGYTNLFKMKKQNKTQETIEGIITNTLTRPLILKQLSGYVSEDPSRVRARKIINELITLIYKNGKVQQKSGYNDDLAMQLQFAYFIRENSIKKSVYDNTTEHHILNLLKSVSIREIVNMDKLDIQNNEYDVSFNDEKIPLNQSLNNKLNVIKKIL